VLEAGGQRFALGDSLQPLGFSNNGTLRGRVVFAGYGITAPGYDWDDYAGLDVHDAVVLVLTQEPGEMDSTSRFDGNLNTPFADLRTKAINAREHGAIGLLAVNGPRWHAGEPPRTSGTRRRGLHVERAAGGVDLAAGRGGPAAWHRHLAGPGAGPDRERAEARLLRRARQRLAHAQRAKVACGHAQRRRPPSPGGSPRG
jgi:hypothetical protein